MNHVITDELLTLPAAALFDPEFARLLDHLTERLIAGECLDLEALAREHREHAESLRELVPAMQAVAQLAQPDPAAGAAQKLPLPLGEGGVRELGDFRILREIGRGGMGIVYEAEQLSLGRRVALKVLPFAGMLDERQLQRFKNEARAAATLAHPNVVPIYAVGSERGVHYYAMQLIEGRSMGEVLEALRRDTKAPLPSRERPGEGESSPQSTVRNLNSELHAPNSALDTVAAALPTRADTSPSNQFAGGIHKPKYIRSIANLAIQAAGALDHAHSVGIVHRDIKPANLLLAPAGGRESFSRRTVSPNDDALCEKDSRPLQLWVTDFGLARIQSDVGMTMTGDLVGTMRYMSPEQALAQRVVVDHRSDIYSLGVTLYELLTLRPAFTGSDRQELLRQIAFEEPIAPRKLNPSIPLDLETIVLKAMAKNPDERYATARDLADDLQCLERSEPIKARRAGWREHITKWSRRHSALVSSAVAALLLTAAILTTAVVLVGDAYHSESQQRTSAENERDAGKDNLYVADMRLAFRDWQDSNIDRLKAALKRHEPDDGSKDRRGWEWFLLDSLCKQAKWSIDIRSQSPRRSLAWSPDGKWIAFADSIHGAQVLDAATGKAANRFGTSSHLIAWKGDSTELLSATAEGRVQIWKVSTGQCVHSLEVPNDLHALAWTSDGSKLAISRGDSRHPSALYNNIPVIDVHTGAIICDLQVGRKVNVNDLAWNSDNRLLACACEDNAVRIFDIEANGLLRMIPTKDEAFSAAWSPDETRIVAGGMDGNVEAFDVATGERQFWSPLGSAAQHLRWNPDGTRIAAALRRGAADILDAQTGDTVLSLKGHVGWVRRVSWSPNGLQLVTCGEDGVKMWDVAQLNPIEVKLDSSASRSADVKWNSDDEYLGCDYGDVIHIIDAAKCEVVQRVAVDGAWSWSPTQPTRLAVVAGGRLKVVRTSDNATIAEIRKMDDLGALSYSPDGRFLAVAIGNANKIEVWDVERKSIVAELADDTHWPMDIAWSPQGNILAHSDGWNGVVALYNTTNWKPLRKLTDHQLWLYDLNWSPDGALLAGSGWDQHVWIWDVASGRASHKLVGHSGPASRLTWSRQGDRLASIPYIDNFVRIWNTKTGEEMLALPSFKANCAAWSNDGKRLALGCLDGVVRIWDAKSAP